MIQIESEATAVTKMLQAEVVEDRHPGTIRTADYESLAVLFLLSRIDSDCACLLYRLGRDPMPQCGRKSPARK
jgi:hypothetical protein